MRSQSFLACCLLSLTCAALAADEPRIVEGWGTVVDPKGDCRITERNGTLEIAVPATLHDLNPRNGALTAPRVVQKMTGDFALKVRVTLALKPGARSTAPRSRPFISAGLLVGADEKNYVRLERNAWHTADGIRSYPPLLEVFTGGADQRTNPPAGPSAFFRTDSTTLVIVREGNWLSAHLSHDGKKWEVVKNVRATLPDEVFVGVAAVNTSNRPVTARFDDFEVRRTVAAVE